MDTRPSSFAEAAVSGAVATAVVVRLALIGAALSIGAVVQAQTGLAPPSEPVPSPAASAAAVPVPLRPTPKVTAPSDAQRSLDLNNPQPEGKVTPQIRIPLGKKGDAPIFQRRGKPDAGATAPANGAIDDAAARCDSQRGEAARTKCRDDSARQSPK